MKRRIFLTLLVLCIFFLLPNTARAAEIESAYDVTPQMVEDNFRYLDEFYLDTYPEAALRFQYGSSADQQVLQELADRITAGCSTDREKTDAIAKWVEKNIRYTTYASAYPMDAFYNRKGNCMSYALLMEQLSRLCGIPAVMGEGWRGDMTSQLPSEFNSWKGHAWCFAYVDGQWLMYDPLWEDEALSLSDKDYIARNYYTQTVGLVTPAYDSSNLPTNVLTCYLYYTDGRFMLYTYGSPTDNNSSISSLNFMTVKVLTNQSTAVRDDNITYLDGRDESGMLQGEAYRDGWVMNGDALTYSMENGVQADATVMTLDGTDYFMDSGYALQIEAPEGQYSIVNGNFAVEVGYSGPGLAPNWYDPDSEEFRFTWSSDNESILTVDSEGSITALAEGTTFIKLSKLSTETGGLMREYSFAITVHGERHPVYQEVPVDLSWCALYMDQWEFIYDGTEKCPQVTLTYSGYTLVQDQDYTITYENNVEPGMAYVTITGIAPYSGSLKMGYTICKQTQTLDCSVRALRLHPGETASIDYAFSGTGLTFTSDAPSVATVSSSGTITAVSPGGAAITLYSPETDYTNGVSHLIAVTVSHSWSDWTVTKAATATAEGLKQRSCTQCGETETKAIAKLTSTSGKTYTVSFNLNGGTGTIPATQTVAAGSYATLPTQEPTRPGYVFKGWYPNKLCTGEAWFSSQNFYSGSAVTSNITLYAKWKVDTKSLIYGIDTYQFINGKSAFFKNPSVPETYRLSGDYYDIMMDGLSGNRLFGERHRVLDLLDSEAGGFCFGMCAVAALVRAGDLDTDFFQRGADTLYQWAYPCQSETIYNLLSYYHIMQVTSTTRSAKSYHYFNESKNAAAIVDAVLNSSYPVIIGFDIRGNDPGSHAVLAYGCTANASGYYIDIFDPNESDPNTLFISLDYSSAYFQDIYDSNGSSSFLMYAMTVEDDAYDYKNIQSELIALGNSNGWSGLSARTGSIEPRTAAISSESDLEITTNYDCFTISNGVDSAYIVDGVQVSGDLEVSGICHLNETGYRVQLSFYLPALADNAFYLITPELEVDPEDGRDLSGYKTTLFDPDEDGYYVTYESDWPSTVVFYSDTRICSESDESRHQTVSVTRNDMTSSWYTIELDFYSAQAEVTVTASETSFSAPYASYVTVTVRNDYNSYTFDEQQRSELEIYEGSNGVTYLCEPSGGIWQTGRMGSALIFYTLGGSLIDAQTDIPVGSTATQPENPTREGFLFGGWYTSPECADGQEWSFDTRLSEDTRIYAKWTVDKNSCHAITFRAEGFEDSVILVRHGGSLTEEELPAVPERSGYTGAWALTNFPYITGDMVIEAIYTPNGSTTEPTTPDPEPTTPDPDPTTPDPEPTDPGPGDLAELPFTDVTTSNWFYPPVQYLYSRDIITGITDTTFVPNDPITRAQVVIMLYRMEGSPEVTYTPSFSDVPDGKWYTDAVIWASQNGIVNGKGDGTFDPNGNILRQELIAIIYRYAGSYKGMNVSARANLSGYTDRNKVQSYAMDAFQWGVATTIINGMDATTLAPRGTATRAQFSKILYVFMTQVQ